MMTYRGEHGDRFLVGTPSDPSVGLAAIDAAAVAVAPSFAPSSSISLTPRMSCESGERKQFVA